ncbi:COP23 domain-containing protein [Planktothricoides raciborskii]|uniref:COP23 domain-containing protein n=1 Tax=Planktothricoides raciborskii GIHE-MW2 TaxID=2792601 RepID=A0AAU8JLN6_9CYAN
MNIKLLGTVSIASLLVASCSKPTTSSQYTAQETKSDTGTEFICREGYDQTADKRLPTTYAFTGGQKRAIIRWSTEYFSGSDWDPKSRCDEVSPRFQTAYENGTLNFITNGTWNNQPAVCTALQDGGPCADLLITMRPSDDSRQFATELGEVLKGRSTGPMRHSSGNSQVYIQVDIEEFIRNAPVE